MAGNSNPSELLTALLPDWHLLLQGWSASDRLTAAAKEALLLNGEPQALKELVTRWSAGDFSGLPPIVLLPSSSMPGAAGAYAISTGTIYLNQNWLATASAAQALAVLTEELGHHLDVLLNGVDTPGDEGEVFSESLLQQILTGHRSTANTSDSTLVTIGAEQLLAEAAISHSDPDTALLLKNSFSHGALIYGSNPSYVYLGDNYVANLSASRNFVSLQLVSRINGSSSNIRLASFSNANNCLAAGSIARAPRKIKMTVDYGMISAIIS